MSECRSQQWVLRVPKVGGLYFKTAVLITKNADIAFSNNKIGEAKDRESATWGQDFFYT
jgi:hypothetical protein